MTIWRWKKQMPIRKLSCFQRPFFYVGVYVTLGKKTAYDVSNF